VRSLVASSPQLRLRHLRYQSQYSDQKNSLICRPASPKSKLSISRVTSRAALRPADVSGRRRLTRSISSAGTSPPIAAVWPMTKRRVQILLAVARADDARWDQLHIVSGVLSRRQRKPGATPLPYSSADHDRVNDVAE
jgi:hypothetical protein